MTTFLVGVDCVCVSVSQGSKHNLLLMVTWNLVAFDFGLWAGAGQESSCIWKCRDDIFS